MTTTRKPLRAVKLYELFGEEVFLDLYSPIVRLLENERTVLLQYPVLWSWHREAVEHFSVDTSIFNIIGMLYKLHEIKFKQDPSWENPLIGMMFKFLDTIMELGRKLHDKEV